MRPARILLLILLAILAINVAPSNTETTLRREENTTAALYRRATTTITLKSMFNSIFIGVFSFGTPAQTFYLLIDTGSSYTAVADSLCTNCDNPPSIPVYNGGNSLTFQDLRQPVSLHYVGGASLSGTWTLDVAAFGDIAVTLPFGRITLMERLWVSLGFSGIVGLRVGDPTTRYSYPFPSTLEAFTNGGHLDNDVIGCRLVKNNPEHAGEITIGSVDTTHVDGEIYYMPVVWVGGQPDWIIPIADLQIFGKSVAKRGTALVDTGCAFLFLPGPVLSALYAGTGAQRQPDGYWAVPDPFPSDVTFFIGTQQFLMPRDDIPRRDVPKYGELYESTIQEHQDWVLGLPFIMNHYLAFDFGKNAIGLGKRNDYPPPPRVPDVNPEASYAAKSLINELWPDFEAQVAEFPILAGNYAKILETFEEAALQADNVAKTRIGQELLARITGKQGKASRDDVAKLLRIEYGMVNAETVAMAAAEVVATDRDPKTTDEVVQSEVSGLMSLLGLRIGETFNEVLGMLRGQLIAVFIMSLISQTSRPP